MINSEMLFLLDLFRYAIYAVLLVFWHTIMAKLIIRFKLKNIATQGIATRAALSVALCYYEVLVWGLRV